MCHFRVLRLKTQMDIDERTLANDGLFGIREELEFTLPMKDPKRCQIYISKDCLKLMLV